MACSGCFDGCNEVGSTNCSKYTGPDIPELGIENGDSLTTVISKITTIITSVISGEGIIPTIDIDDVCKVVKDNLPTSGDINLNDYLKALIATSCSLDERINSINSQVNQVESSYDVCCLDGVDENSKTHQVLQATVKRVCAVDKALTAFILNVTTNYVKKSELDGYIAEYLADQQDNTYRNRLVPYTAYEYYGPLTAFDISGKGTGLFTDVYLCNGQNGTPDRRGFTAVGVTTGMGGGALNPLVDPISAGNPSYTLNGINGANTVTLTTQQIPSHSHNASSTATSDPHTHALAKNGPRDSNTNPIGTIDTHPDVGNNKEYELRSTAGVADLFRSSSTSVNVTVNTTVNATGGGQSHPNVQPSKGCYFIMYIPS